jgi:hypothetical protein
MEVRAMETTKRGLGDEYLDMLKLQSRNSEVLLLVGTCFQRQKRVLGYYHPDTESSLESLNEWQMKYTDKAFVLL